MVVRKLGQKVLNLRIVQKFLLRQSQNSECLFFCNESALDAQPFLGDLSAASVDKSLLLIVLFGEVSLHSPEAVLRSKWPNHVGLRCQLPQGLPVDHINVTRSAVGVIGVFRLPLLQRKLAFLLLNRF